MTTVVICYFET